jgi:hypothetical protein
VTWKLWRALRYPMTKHRLFAYAAAQHPTRRRGRKVSALLAYMLSCLGLALVWPGVMQALTTHTAVVVMGVLLTFNTAYNARRAGGIGSAIANEQERGRYDVLCLLPGGTLETNWVICNARLHRTGQFGDLNRLAGLAYVALLLALVLQLCIPLLIGLATPFGIPEQKTAADMAGSILDSIAIITIIYIDYVQSSVLACLVSMGTPFFTTARLDGWLWAMGGFTLLQLVSYYAAWWTGMVGLVVVMERFHVSGLLVRLVLPLVQVGVFYLIREAMIVRLWQALARRMTATASELAAIMEH